MDKSIIQSNSMLNSDERRFSDLNLYTSYVSSPKDSLDSYDSKFTININLNSNDIPIKNIEGENQINDYTNTTNIYNNENNFSGWYNISDVSFQDNYIFSNNIKSPRRFSRSKTTIQQQKTKNNISHNNNTNFELCETDINSKLEKKNPNWELSNDIDLESNNGDFYFLKHNNEISFPRKKMSNPSMLSGSDSSVYIGYGYSSEDSYDSNIIKAKGKHKYKKLSNQDVEKFINKYYNIDPDNKYSNEIDILTTYTNGQKNLYIQSKYITQYKLNLLTFPSIFITAVVTMIAPFIECKEWSGGFISALNAVILLLISIVNYLKYESSIEVFLQNAKQYDKLEISLEMANNKLSFLEKEKDKGALVLNKIREMEKKIYEIKESNNVLIPEEIKRLFPIICNVNIFSLIKKIEMSKKVLIDKLKDVKNEIRFIIYKWGNEDFITEETIIDDVKKKMSEIQNSEYLNQKKRLMFLYEIKNKLKEEIIELYQSYNHIDSIFSKEISIADSKKNSCLFCYYYFFKTRRDKSYCKTNNSFLDKYFNFIFADL
jgi:hypothetical protein